MSLILTNNTKREHILNGFCNLIANDNSSYESLIHLLRTNNQPTNSFITPYLQYIPELITLVTALPRHRYRFNDTVEIFADCCELYPFQDIQSLQYVCHHPQANYSPINHQLIAFLTELKTRLSTPQYRYQLTDTQRETRKQITDYRDYIDNLLAYHSRLVVIRIDLFYLNDLAKEVELEDLERHLRQLHNNSRNNRLFDDLCGYITKIEYGFEKHFHVHAYFFFNGNVRQGRFDVQLAQEIGDYWHRVITKGDGWYFNCNAKKNDYQHNGIGEVQARDNVKREYLKTAIEYLCKKDEQIIKPHHQPHKRLISRGKLLDVENKKGRPREFDFIDASTFV